MTISWLTARRARPAQRQPAPPEISLLARLASELDRFDVKIRPGPDEMALLVYESGGLLPIWVFVGDGGASFCWDSSRRHHPVTDVAGAAAALAAWMGGERH